MSVTNTAPPLDLKNLLQKTRTAARASALKDFPLFSERRVQDFLKKKRIAVFYMTNSLCDPKGRKPVDDEVEEEEKIHQMEIGLKRTKSSVEEVLSADRTVVAHRSNPSGPAGIDHDSIRFNALLEYLDAFGFTVSMVSPKCGVDVGTEYPRHVNVTLGTSSRFWTTDVPAWGVFPAFTCIFLDYNRMISGSSYGSDRTSIFFQQGMFFIIVFMIMLIYFQGLSTFMVSWPLVEIFSFRARKMLSRRISRGFGGYQPCTPVRPFLPRSVRSL